VFVEQLAEGRSRNRLKCQFRDPCGRGSWFNASLPVTPVIGSEDRKQRARKGLVWRAEGFRSIEEAPVTIRFLILTCLLAVGSDALQQCDGTESLL
jgi:hypothetical protein